jgi:hypothetical protein
MNTTEYSGEHFRMKSEFRRLRMTPRTMELATEIQDIFKQRGGIPTSLEFVVECSIAMLHEDLTDLASTEAISAS